GGYLYRAVTAYHVLEDVLAQMESDPAFIPECILTFQPEFHGPELMLELVINPTDWALPAHDWMSFTFESDVRLECADVATEADFTAIKAFEPIFGVACAGPYGQQLRQGMLASAHNFGT